MSMQMIMAASQSMAKMQTMQSARTQMQGQANILRSESKQDGGDEKKETQAEALDEKSNKLMSDLMDELKDVNEILKPDEEIGRETDEKEEVTVEPKRDSIELSNTAKQLSVSTLIKSVTLEAVIYKPDGDTVSSTSKEDISAFEIIA